MLGLLHAFKPKEQKWGGEKKREMKRGNYYGGKKGKEDRKMEGKGRCGEGAMGIVKKKKNEEWETGKEI